MLYLRRDEEGGRLAVPEELVGDAVPDGGLGGWKRRGPRHGVSDTTMYATWMKISTCVSRLK
jgi:hypothetical protein